MFFCFVLVFIFCTGCAFAAPAKKEFHRPQTEAEEALDAILSREMDDKRWDVYGFVFNYPGSREKQEKELGQLFTKDFLDRSEKEEKALIKESCGGVYPENDLPCDMIRGVNPIVCAQDIPEIYLYRTISADANTASVTYTWSGQDDGPVYQMVRQGNLWKLNATSCKE